MESTKIIHAVIAVACRAVTAGSSSADRTRQIVRTITAIFKCLSPLLPADVTECSVLADIGHQLLTTGLPVGSPSAPADYAQDVIPAEAAPAVLHALQELLWLCRLPALNVGRMQSLIYQIFQRAVAHIGSTAICSASAAVVISFVQLLILVRAVFMRTAMCCLKMR